MRRCVPALLGLFTLLMLALPAMASEAPRWFRHHMEYMAAEGGRWVTSNAAYQSDDEPFDAFGMEWTLAVGGQALVGRLFGLRDGKEVGTFWTFQEFWHPGEHRAVITQIGLGAQVGAGTIDSVDVHVTRSVQTFYYTQGMTEELGHLATEVDSLTTASFEITPDQEWTPRRTYVWYREPR